MGVIDTLAILAPGLLGASVARAVHARGLARRIVLWARRPAARLELEKQAWCSAVADQAIDAVREADLVVLAAPVDKIVELSRLIGPHLKSGAIVTDVGSVKGELCRAATAAMPATATFVGSHPMAGGAHTGWMHADPELFVRRPCFVTPLRGGNEDAVTTISRFWRELGAEVVNLSPDEHDEIVAHISHLPQILATSLATQLSAKPGAWRHLAGNGLRDTTRIAASDATMWVEIFQQNRDEILRALRAAEDELHGFQTALANNDWLELRARLERGKAWRDGFRP